MKQITRLFTGLALAGVLLPAGAFAQDVTPVQPAKFLCANNAEQMTPEQVVNLTQLANVFMDEAHIETTVLNGSGANRNWTVLRVRSVNNTSGEVEKTSYGLFNTGEGWGCGIAASTAQSVLSYMGLK